MAMDYTQFRIVLTDKQAREQVGLQLDEAELAELQGNEARALAFFHTWIQDESAAPTLVTITLPRWSGWAIAAFVVSLVANVSLTVGTANPSVLIAAVGVGMGISSLPETRNGVRRGRGLAIAAIVLSITAATLQVIGAFTHI